MKTKHKDKTAFSLAIISAVFLFLSGANGFASFSGIEKTIINFTGFSFVSYLFTPILIVASLGAFAVLFGAILIKKKKRLPARILIWVGSGVGLIGFVFHLVLAFASTDFSIYSYLSLSSLGIIFSVLSQVFLGK